MSEQTVEDKGWKQGDLPRRWLQGSVVVIQVRAGVAWAKLVAAQVLRGGWVLEVSLK